MKPKLLLSNDDGINSPFLPPFIKALTQVAELEIVVPAREQSWIGRAYSRHSEIEVKDIGEFCGAHCHTVGGTPSDCVNIALSHLCKEPDAVVSGLNIGQNVAFPLLWSSGTFAAAVEAAGWGFAAFAFSMRLEKAYYEACRIQHAPAPPKLLENLEAAAEHAATFIIDTLDKKNLPSGCVANVNYPIRYERDTEFLNCSPANAKLSSLYVRNERGNYDFAYAIGQTSSPDGTLTDIECLNEGKACYSMIPIAR